MQTFDFVIYSWLDFDMINYKFNEWKYYSASLQEFWISSLPRMSMIWVSQPIFQYYGGGTIKGAAENM